jgi:hypothetical protein
MDPNLDRAQICGSEEVLTCRYANRYFATFFVRTSITVCRNVGMQFQSNISLRVADLKLQTLRLQICEYAVSEKHFRKRKLRTCSCGSASFNLVNCDCGYKFTDIGNLTVLLHVEPERLLRSAGGVARYEEIRRQVRKE